jgi:hypothetical protein
MGGSVGLFGAPVAAPLHMRQTQNPGLSNFM